MATFSLKLKKIFKRLFLRIRKIANFLNSKAEESESQLLQSATREEELQAELRALQKAVDREKQTKEEIVSKVRQLENEVVNLIISGMIIWKATRMFDAIPRD